MKLFPKINTSMRVNKIGFKVIGGSGSIEGDISLLTEIGNIKKIMKFYVVNENNFQYDVLLGLDAIKHFHLKQDYDMKVYQRPIFHKGNNSTSPPSPRTVEKDEAPLTLESPSSAIQPRHFMVNFNEGIEFQKFEAKVDHLPSDKKEII